MHHRRCGLLRVAADRRIRVLRRLLNQLHRNVGVGARAATSSTCPPTARSATSGSAGPATSQSSRPLPPTCSMSRTSSGVAGQLRRRAAGGRRHGGLRRAGRPEVRQTAIPFPAPESTAIWSDAAVWVPWALWQAYGDRQVLSDQFDSMVAHVRRVESLLSPTGLWDTGFQFGDWLDPTAPPDDPASKADNGVVATACLYRDARIVAETAALLGRSEDAVHFADLAERTRTAVQRALRQRRRHRSQRCANGVRAGHRLRPARSRRPTQLAGKRLAELVAESGYRIQTGFAGTPYVTGRADARPAISTRPIGCCSSASARRGSTRSRWARRRSGSDGTRCCRTARSTPAR